MAFVTLTMPFRAKCSAEVFLRPNELMKTQLRISALFYRLTLFTRRLGGINSRPNLSREECALVFLAILGFFLFLFGPSIQAEFSVIEDHTLFGRSSYAIADWVAHIVGDVQFFGRFRPVYWLYVSMSYLLFGTNPKFWHIAALLWGILTCYMFYLSLRKFGADMASTFIFYIAPVLSGRQIGSGLVLSRRRQIGMLLTAMAVWAIALPHLKESRPADGMSWSLCLWPLLDSLKKVSSSSYRRCCCCA